MGAGIECRRASLCARGVGEDFELDDGERSINDVTRKKLSGDEVSSPWPYERGLMLVMVSESALREACSPKRL